MTPDLRGLGQVDLGDVGRDDELRIEPGPGQDHLHLLPGRVLGLVEDDEGAVERPAAHEGQGGDLDDAALDQPVGLVVLEQVEQGVVEGPEIGVDLLDEVPGEEAELLARLDRGAGQDDAVDGLVLEEGQGHGHGQIGLARAGRADAEDEVVGLDGLEVGLLVQALGIDGLAGQVQGLGGGIVVEAGGRALFEHVQGDEQVLLPELMALFPELPELVEVVPGGGDLDGVPVDEELVAAKRQADAQAGFELFQGFPLDAGQGGFVHQRNE